MVGVAGFVAAGGDGDAAAGGDEAFGFAEVVAEVRVDGDEEGAVFEGLEETGGEMFGDADGLIGDFGLRIADLNRRRERRKRRDGGGEVEAGDFVGEFLLGVFEEAEAEAGHVDEKAFEVGEVEDGFEALLLVRKAHGVEAE